MFDKNIRSVNEFIAQEKPFLWSVAILIFIILLLLVFPNMPFVEYGVVLFCLSMAATSLLGIGVVIKRLNAPYKSKLRDVFYVLFSGIWASVLTIILSAQSANIKSGSSVLELIVSGSITIAFYLPLFMIGAFICLLFIVEQNSSPESFPSAVQSLSSEKPKSPKQKKNSFKFPNWKWGGLAVFIFAAFILLLARPTTYEIKAPIETLPILTNITLEYSTFTIFCPEGGLSDKYAIKGDTLKCNLTISGDFARDNQEGKPVTLAIVKPPRHLVGSQVEKTYENTTWLQEAVPANTKEYLFDAVVPDSDSFMFFMDFPDYYEMYPEKGYTREIGYITTTEQVLNYARQENEKKILFIVSLFGIFAGIEGLRQLCNNR